MSGPTPAAAPVSRWDRLLGIARFADSDRARVGRWVGSVGLSGSLALAVGLVMIAVSESPPDRGSLLALTLMIGLCLLALLLVRRGAVTSAGRLLFLTGALGTTALVHTGRTVGFADTAMMLYPVLVIMATLFFDRAEAALSMGLILALISGNLVALLLGVTANPLPAAALLADYGFATVIVAMSGIAAWLMAADIGRSETEIRANQEALARANRKLGARVAQRDELIRELEARNEELRRFTNTVSHDLKTPLVTIGAFVGCVRNDALSGNRRRLLADIGRIKEAHETMSALLADLLELSRIGRERREPETVPLTEVVAEAVASLRLAEAEVDLRILPPLPRVRGDRARLVELLRHLIDNAVKFSAGAARPTVEIGCRRRGDEIALYVRDEGIGIDPSHHERVFEPFRQLRPRTPGTGIGLALARRIVEVHGGSIWVDPAGGRRGTEIRFTLAHARMGDG